jgi:hypothetical protein
MMMKMMMMMLMMMMKMMMGQGFGLVVTAAGRHACDLGSILIRDGFYTSGCKPQRLEFASA